MNSLLFIFHYAWEVVVALIKAVVIILACSFGLNIQELVPHPPNERYEAYPYGPSSTKHIHVNEFKFN